MSRQHSHQEGRHFAVHLFVHTEHAQKAGPFSVARLTMDLHFHNRLALTGEVPALFSHPTVFSHPTAVGALTSAVCIAVPAATRTSSMFRSRRCSPNRTTCGPREPIL